ncbi:MAG: hypothetical protein O2901_12345 [Verrucomicrobia bacterium]|nr:hypothetical protein [Verrucomicrobiota bacterium]
MKKLIVFVAAVMIVSFAAVAFAGPACCPVTAAAAKKAEGSTANVEKADACMDVLAELDLTKEQQEKLAALKTDCSEQKCSVSAATKLMAGVKQLLTPEQLEQCKTKCTAAGKKDCPMLESKVKADKKI